MKSQLFSRASPADDGRKRMVLQLFTEQIILRGKESSMNSLHEIKLFRQSHPAGSHVIHNAGGTEEVSQNRQEQQQCSPYETITNGGIRTYDGHPIPAYAKPTFRRYISESGDERMDTIAYYLNHLLNMDRFKELGITHGSHKRQNENKMSLCHAQRTDKRDKSLSVNLDTKPGRYYCGAHGSAAIYAGKSRKLGDPLVKFPTATGSNSGCPPTEKPHGDQSKGHSHRSKLKWCRRPRHTRREHRKLAVFASSRCLYPERRKVGKKRDCSLLQLFSKT